MTVEQESIFAEDEIDILQEIMNIAFGNATADLADVIDIYVLLSVPNIKVLKMGDLPKYIISIIEDYSEISIVDQKFWGDFNGSGVLIFPNRSSKDLIDLLEDNDERDLSSQPIAALEKEILLEIGNILIGACVGKVSELLNTYVTYSPPLVINEKSNEYNSFLESFDAAQRAIVMKTVFKFEKKDVNGLMLILTNQESIGWLRQALHDFMESYE